MSGVKVTVRMANGDAYTVSRMEPANVLELTEEFAYMEDPRPLVLTLDRTDAPALVVHLSRSQVSSLEIE